MRPRGVLWDVGNVIVGWNPRRLYSQIFSDPTACDDFLARVCTPAWHGEHDRGAAFEDNRVGLIARFPEHEAAIQAWDERFLEMVGPPIPETESVMDALAARGVPMFGLTNMPQSKWAAVQTLTPAFAHLRDTVVSGDEGMVKPDPRIFEIACARSGRAAVVLLFFVDLGANVVGGRALGFHVHHLTDPNELRGTLVEHGLL
jgi:HAD superfamily hydrolase (TIGR01509 family)